MPTEKQMAARARAKAAMANFFKLKIARLAARRRKGAQWRKLPENIEYRRLYDKNRSARLKAGVPLAEL